MRIGVSEANAVFAVALLCSGCGIAHRRVLVPPMEIHVQNAGAHEIDIFCPHPYASSSTLIEIIVDSLDETSTRDDLKRVSAEANPTKSTTCHEESRYLGSLMVLFIPIGPNDLEARVQRRA